MLMSPLEPQMVEKVDAKVGFRAGPSRNSSAVAIALVVVAVIGISVATSVLAAAASYTVDIQVAGPTKLSAAQVAQIATARISSMEAVTSAPAVAAKVTSVAAMSQSSVSSLEPGAGQPPLGSADAQSTVWVVRATGTFVGLRVPKGAQPIVASSGYFVIDDATGEIITMGMP
jgi:hypothetical protein